MARKPLRNTSPLAAITPTIPEPTTNNLLLTRTTAELVHLRDALGKANTEIANLRRLLRAERVTHGKLEHALGRYQAVLEATLAEQAEGLSALRIALLPRLKVGQ